MKRFIQGECRGQNTPLPERLDDYVVDANSTSCTFLRCL